MIELSDEDKKEAKLKAFELFLTCMNSGPCNDCPFFSDQLNSLYGPCYIGCPNSWPLFDPYTKEGAANRKMVLNFLSRMESKND